LLALHGSDRQKPAGRDCRFQRQNIRGAPQLRSRMVYAAVQENSKFSGLRPPATNLP
jgi:hypothetical protein